MNNFIKSFIRFSSPLCPQLTSVLREVKYLGMLKNQNIPKAALHLYSKRERLYMVGKKASSVVMSRQLLVYL